ncbi:MAG TPA: response regulator [Polyangia bacterium]|jgi:CheY-like chemotaxis protein|nr:response regulator [Polyangia bacterium]
MSQITARWQRTIYSFAELGAGIDYLLNRRYLEKREDPTEALYLTEEGHAVLRSQQDRPKSARTSQRLRARNQAHCERPILLVEDDDAFRQALEEELVRAGHHVITAADGQEALEMLQANAPPCVLLLDLMMPRVNGWQVLNVLRSDPRFTNLPVIVLTAIAERAPKDTILFRKPLQLDTLLSTVAEKCRRTA